MGFSWWSNDAARRSKGFARPLGGFLMIYPRSNIFLRITGIVECWGNCKISARKRVSLIFTNRILTVDFASCLAAGNSHYILLTCFCFLGIPGPTPPLSPMTHTMESAHSGKNYVYYVVAIPQVFFSAVIAIFLALDFDSLKSGTRELARC